MKQLNLILNVMLAGCVVLSFSSCGTILSGATGGKRPVFMMMAPDDLEVKANGIPVDLTKEVYASYENSGGTTGIGTTNSFYTKGARLPFKKDQVLELSSKSTGQKASVTLESKGKGGIILMDLFLTGAAGLLVDIPTGNHKILKPNYVDVESALAGKPVKDWRGSGSLKVAQNKKIKKGK